MLRGTRERSPKLQLLRNTSDNKRSESELYGEFSYDVPAAILVF